MPTADATSADIVPERARAPRRAWWQFSLFSLLLLLLAGCAVAAWIGEMRRREAAERDTAHVKAAMRDLRTAVGLTDDRPDVLKITDEKQVYVRAFPPHDDLAWQWRIYVPPGRRWRVCISHGETWDESQQRYSGGSDSLLNVDGEFTLNARIVRKLSDGRPFITAGTVRSSMGTLLPEKGLATLGSDGKLTAAYTGIKQQEVFAPNGPIPLLRWHRQWGPGSSLDGANLSNAQETAPAPFPEYGLTIHLEQSTLPGALRPGGALPAAKPAAGGSP